MCGFVCVLTRPGLTPDPISPTLLSHRGPDSTAETVYKNIRVRHWRLSIVDLTPYSDQPIETDRSILAYNGEIYGYKDISNELFGEESRSDTRLILDLLENELKDHFKHASGFFSYIYINKSQLTVEGGRDIFGQKPLFYYIDEKLAIFASEEKAIKDTLAISPNIDEQSIASYLYYKSFFFGNTIYSQIKEIPPGSSFKFDTKMWNLYLDSDWDAYYHSSLIEDIPFLEESHFSSRRPELQDLLIPALSLAIRDRFECDVPLQLALSGGVDSSFLLTHVAANPGLFSRLTQAITLGFNLGSDEVPKASAFAHSLGVQHTVHHVDPDEFLDEFVDSVSANSSPLEHPHSISYNILTRVARLTGKVLLTGEGADELLLGYSHYRHNSLADSFAFRPYIKHEEYFVGSMSSQASALSYQITPLREEALSDKLNSRRLECKTHLLSLLRRNDKMSMHNSVEIRSPFLDQRLFALIDSILSDQNAIHMITKSPLLAYIQHHQAAYYPDAVKIGFYTPFDQWFDAYKHSTSVHSYLTRALEYLSDIHGIVLKQDQETTGRLAWTLLNIGIFLDIS